MFKTLTSNTTWKWTPGTNPLIVLIHDVTFIQIWCYAQVCVQVLYLSTFHMFHSFHNFRCIKNPITHNYIMHHQHCTLGWSKGFNGKVLMIIKTYITKLCWPTYTSLCEGRKHKDIKFMLLVLGLSRIDYFLINILDMALSCILMTFSWRSAC